MVLVASGAYAGYFDSNFITQPIAYRMSGKIWVNYTTRIVLKALFNYDQGFIYYSSGAFKNIHALSITPKQVEHNSTLLSYCTKMLMQIDFPDNNEEQRAIAAVLSDMDAEIAALEQRRDKTIAIKQGMMQQLLTGKVRLSESRIITDDAD